MSEVYIIEQSAAHELRRAVMEAPASDEVLHLVARKIGEESVRACMISVDTVHVFRDTNPATVEDEVPGPIPLVYVATGRAAFEGDEPRAAALTIHAATDLTPACELEIADKDDIG